MNNSAKLLFLHLILSLSLLVIAESLLLAISRLKKLINFNTLKILKNKLVFVLDKLILFFNVQSIKLTNNRGIQYKYNL